MRVGGSASRVALRRYSSPQAANASVGAAGRDRERPAYPAHLRGVQRADERDEACALDGLHVIKVHGRFVLQPLVNADSHLARGSATRGRDRRHHDRVQQRDDVLSGQDQGWPALIGRLEPVLPDVTAVHRSGHAPSSSQPLKSALKSPVPYARAYCLAMSSLRRFRRYSSAARRRTADRPSRWTSSSASSFASSSSSIVTCIAFTASRYHIDHVGKYVVGGGDTARRWPRQTPHSSLARRIS